jgi:hypothetical protein
MPLRVPESGCHWADKKADTLSSCFFDMYVTKMENIQDEFGGSPRKQTKQETIVEGFKAVHNAAAATNLVGAKFMISKTGKQLHMTTLPTDVLRQFPLPQEYEDAINGGPKAKPAQPTGSGAFASFAKIGSTSPTPFGNSVDTESRKISLASKCMFLQLAASLEIIYSDETDEYFIAEVKDKPDPTTLVEAVFNNGEHPEGNEKFVISFGLLKKVD